MHRLLLLAVSILLALPLFAASAALPENNAVISGAAFIKSTQNQNGVYGSDSPGQMMDATLAVRSAGYDPSKDLVDGKGPLQFLNATAAKATSPAAAGKAALGAKALGLDPKSVNGTDLISVVNAGYNTETGAYASDDFSQSIAMLGLSCTGNQVGAKAIAALKATAVKDGGWGFGGAADPDTTSIALQALLAAGVAKSDAAVASGLAYLKANQGNDGGWGFDPNESNTSSTAFVVQALLALGENPEAAAYTKNGATPVSYLLSQQNADGSFKGFDPAYATNQVLPALAGRTFCNAAETPITRVRPTATPTATPTTPPPAPTTAVPATTTPAPRPPATGNSAAPGEEGSLAIVLAGFLLVAAGGGLVVLRRR